MPTTRLSRVMTGWGGKLNTCSRRSRSGSSRSTNGTTMFSPAFSVRWYRPNRSTIPARACGMMRTDRQTTRAMRATRTTSRTVATRVLMTAPLRGPAAGYRACLQRYRPRASWAREGLFGAGGPAGPAVLDLELDAEAAGQGPRGEHLIDRPGRQHRPAAQHHGVGEAVRDLFHVVGDQHHHRRLGVAGELGEAAQQVLTAAQVQARGRLVEQQQLGVGHHGPGDLNPLALPLGQRGELAPDQVRAAERVEQFDGAGDVGGVVVLLPPAEDRVGGGEHQVDDLLVRRDLLGDGGAGQADPGAQVEDVHLPQLLAEHLDRALGREQRGRRHLEQGGLARAVRADEDPALVLVRRPVDVAQQDRGVPADLDPAEPQHLVGHQGAPFSLLSLETEPTSPDPARPRLSGRVLVPDREQRGLGAVLHTELGQHRADVGLDRLLRDVQGTGDLAVGAALGQFGQDPAHAGGEGVQAAAGPGGRLEQGPGRLGGQQQVAVVHGPDRADQRVRIHVLVQHARRAPAHGPAGRDRVGDAVQDEHLGRGVLELFQNREAVQAGELEVEQDDVGLVFRGPGERGGAVARLTGHLDAVLDLEQDAQALADHRVVVDDQHPDGHGSLPVRLISTVIRTRVPVPPDLMASVPPAAAARSRMEARPTPPDGACGVKPWPSSPTSRLTRRVLRARRTRTVVAPECCSALCRASWATRYRAASFLASRAGSSAAVNVTGIPCARPASAAYLRSDSARPPGCRSGGARPSITARSSAWASAPRVPIVSISARTRSGSNGSRPASTAAARACARMLNSFWVTASCRSRASLDRSCMTLSSRLRSYSRALVSAMAACAANRDKISWSRSVKPCFSAAAEILLAAKMMPST